MTDAVVGAKIFNKIKDAKRGYSSFKGMMGLRLQTAVTRTWAKPVKLVGGKIGVFAIAATLYTLHNDYENNNGWDVVKSMGVDIVAFGLGVGAGIGAAALGLTFAPAVITVGAAGLGIAVLGYQVKKKLGVN